MVITFNLLKTMRKMGIKYLVLPLHASFIGLKSAKYVYRSMLYGVRWPSDVKQIALAIDQLKNLEYCRLKS